jgi:hypothetical protein
MTMAFGVKHNSCGIRTAQRADPTTNLVCNQGTIEHAKTETFILGV